MFLYKRSYIYIYIYICILIIYMFLSFRKAFRPNLSPNLAQIANQVLGAEGAARSSSAHPAALLRVAKKNMNDVDDMEVMEVMDDTVRQYHSTTVRRYVYI